MPRMLLVTRLLCACLTLHIAGTTSARAQEAPAPKGYAEAVQRALSELDEGNFPEAREEFWRAHALFPNARTLRGLGMVEFELRNYRSSVDYLEQALASQIKPLTGQLRAESEELLGRAERYLGKLVLTISPREASVTIDGVAAPDATTGRLRLEVGKHTIEAQHAGYMLGRGSVEIRGGETTSLALSLVKVETDDNKQNLAGKSSDAPRKDAPRYKHWWIWTTAAVLVVGAGVTAAVLLTRDRDTDKTAVSGTNTVGVSFHTLSQR